MGHHKNASFTLGFVACALLFAACHADERAVCEVQADCYGWSDDEEKACREMMEGNRKAAQKLDCKDEWKDYVECFADNLECEADTDDGETLTGAEKCVDETYDLGDCSDGFLGMQSPSSDDASSDNPN